MHSRAPDDLLEGARAAGLLAEAAYFFNAPEAVLGSALLAVDLIELAADAAPVPVAYGTLAVLAGMARLHRTARRLLARARAVSEAADDPYQLGVAGFYESMYHACIADWAGSFEAAQQALMQTERVGAHMQSGFLLTLIATNALFTSEYAKTRAWMERVRARAVIMTNEQQLGWSCNVVAVADLHQARFDEAIALSERARALFAQRDLISLIISEGILGSALARCGRLPEALEVADRVTALIGQARPTTWGQLEGFAGPCEVYARALATGAVDGDRVRSRLRTALAGLRLFAWMFPFGRPRQRWILGLLSQARGDRRAARGHLRHAATLARGYGMPFEEMVACDLLAPLVDGLEQARARDRAGVLRLQVEQAAPRLQGEDQAV